MEWFYHLTFIFHGGRLDSEMIGGCSHLSVIDGEFRQFHLSVINGELIGFQRPFGCIQRIVELELPLGCSLKI
jgi:hypothetical protein